MEKVGVGHAGPDVQTGGLGLFLQVDTTLLLLLLLRNTFKLTLQNSNEMWHKRDNFQACLQGRPLGWTCNH